MLNKTSSGWIQQFALMGVLGLAALPVARGADDNALFDSTSLQEIRLTIDPAAWKQLRDNYLSNDYYPGDFV